MGPPPTLTYETQLAPPTLSPPSAQQHGIIMALFTKSGGFANGIGGMECRDGYWAYSGTQDAISDHIGSRVLFRLNDGRVACANGDWCVFKPQDEAVGWEFTLTFDDDTRDYGYSYLSLGGRWLYVDGNGAFNFKGEGEYVFYGAH